MERIKGQIGGNRKRQTYADCEQCGNRFGPIDKMRCNNKEMGELYG